MKVSVKKTRIIERTPIGCMVIVELTTTEVMTIETKESITRIKRTTYSTDVVLADVIYSH
jgi:hypothetical protein